ncbi:MAG: M23/M56 family metallopeptidase [Acidobacteriota bacterium]
MTAVVDLIPAAWREVMLGHLIASTVYSAVVAAVVWSSLMLFRRASPRAHLFLWALVMIRLLLPAGLAHPFSVRAACDSMLAFVATSTSMNTAVLEPDLALVAGAANRSDIRTPMASRALESLLIAGWFLGSLFFSGLYLIRLRSCQRLARRAQAVTDPDVLDLVRRWCDRFGIRRTVRLVAAKGASPFTIGVRHPLIVVPQWLLEPGRERTLEPVIAHEMAHIRRGDAVWLVLQNLLQAAYFFHPAVWIASRHIGAARESVCDDMVLSWRTISSAQYGRGLLTVLRDRTGEMNGVVTGMSLSTRQWKARLDNLKGEHAMKKNAVLAPLISAAVLAFLLLPMGAHTETAGTPAPASPSPPAATAIDPAATPTTPSFVDPLPGARLTSGFGWRIDPTTRKKDFHAGIDLGAPAGSEVLAARAGTVLRVKLNKSAPRGMVVVIDHGGGYETFYAYLQEVSVTENQAVKPGDAIAKIGAVGRSTGPHLHFQVMRDGQPIDPLPLVR